MNGVHRAVTGRVFQLTGRLDAQKAAYPDLQGNISVQEVATEILFGQSAGHYSR